MLLEMPHDRPALLATHARFIDTTASGLAAASTQLRLWSIRTRRLISHFNPLLTHRFWDARPLIGKPFMLLRFIFRVMGDIITANFEVAYLIANPWRKLKPHFIEYPLMLEERFTITLLASTISLTPGTVSANLRMDGKSLLIHALNVDDEEALINQIRERYERPLKEIYEC